MAPNAKKLTEQELEQGVAELSGWSVEDGKLQKTFKFKDFSAALAWMVRAGIEAEKLDHHPDWCNSWNKVEVSLQTHSVGALSELDLKLAAEMDRLEKE